MLLDKPFTRNMRHFGKYTKCRMKVKSPYFTSAAARNSHLNNNIDADGALNFPPTTPPPPPPRLSPSLLRFTGIESYFKPHGKERNRKKQLRSHVGIELAITSHTEGWSVSVSGKLLTYPTPNPTFRFKWEVSDNVDLREGQMCSFPGNLNWSQKAAHYNQLPQSFLLWGCGI